MTGWAVYDHVVPGEKQSVQGNLNEPEVKGHDPAGSLDLLRQSSNSCSHRAMLARLGQALARARRIVQRAANPRNAATVPKRASMTEYSAVNSPGSYPHQPSRRPR
jgi:hypothetical protein